MIQRDYLMRMVQEFINMLMIVLESKKARDWGGGGGGFRSGGEDFFGVGSGSGLSFGGGGVKAEARGHWADA